jgi:hypothetical protein
VRSTVEKGKVCEVKKELIATCWADVPEERLTFAEVVEVTTISKVRNTSNTGHFPGSDLEVEVIWTSNKGKCRTGITDLVISKAVSMLRNDDERSADR